MTDAAHKCGLGIMTFLGVDRDIGFCGTDHIYVY